jgi:hypothetical protein
MSDLSPFETKRYELDGSHVYYIPPKAFDRLEKPVPTFLVGTRGTGKTTLLKALNWEERLYNKWLHTTLGARAFEKHYIGLYFKLPNTRLDLLDLWLADEEDIEYAALLAFYLDLVWLEAAMAAVVHLSARRIIEIDAASEQEFVDWFQAVWNDSPACRELVGPAGSTVLENLALMHPLRRTLESLARKRAPVAEVLNALPDGQIGSFGRGVGAALTRLFDKSGRQTDKTWSFRICMDEGETLSLRQQRVINSMLRLAEWPVVYLVAYVSPPQDSTGTFIPKQSLQLADRQILIRDEMKDTEFRALAQGVVNHRLEAMGIDAKLDVKRLLGVLDIDRLFEMAMRASENEELREVLESARAERTGADDAPAIYESYIRNLSRDLAPRPSDRRDRRKQASQSIRKQMVAAYLTLCKEYRVKPSYASADMVLQISDGCIRDFLWQMDELFTESGCSAEQFLGSTVPFEAQAPALRRAADNKMKLFGEEPTPDRREAGRLVEGLAEVTALIQSTGRSFAQIRSPERGIFRYSLAESKRDSNTVARNVAMIRDAAEWGYLRLLSTSSSLELRFRVHASLAPKYGFSYRGAYYDACQLTDDDIDAFRFAATEQQRKRVVDALNERVTGRRTKSSQTAKRRSDPGSGQLRIVEMDVTDELS